MKVYLAHPISTTGEFNDSIRVANRIKELGYEIYAPALNDKINDKSNNPAPSDIYNQDIDELLSADIVVINYTGGDADGTVFELGLLSGLVEAGDEGVPTALVYSSNARALQPQHHNGIASGKLNHMVLGAIDEHFKWVGTEDNMIEELRKVNDEVKLDTLELQLQNKKLLDDLAKIGNAIHEGEINGQGTDENFILQIVDDAWGGKK